MMAQSPETIKFKVVHKDRSSIDGVLRCTDENWLAALNVILGKPSASEATLRNYLTIIHDNELVLGDRLQRLSALISGLLAGDAPDKYPPHTIREQNNTQPDYNAAIRAYVAAGKRGLDLMGAMKCAVDEALQQPEKAAQQL